MDDGYVFLVRSESREFYVSDRCFLLTPLHTPLKLLIQRQACICGDIVDELPLSQSTVSQHLKELKDQGLIKGEIEGAKMNYCLNSHRIKELKDVLDHFLCEIDCSCNLNCD